LTAANFGRRFISCLCKKYKDKNGSFWQKYKVKKAFSPKVKVKIAAFSPKIKDKIKLYIGKIRWG